jgi:hypothetical protein
MDEGPTEAAADAEELGQIVLAVLDSLIDAAFATATRSPPRPIPRPLTGASSSQDPAEVAAPGAGAPAADAADTVTIADALRDELRPIFDAIDADGSGAISVDEVRALVGRLQLGIGGERVTQMVAEADADGSGELEFDEFVDFIRARLDGPDGDGSSLLTLVMRTAEELGSLAEATLDAVVHGEATERSSGGRRHRGHKPRRGGAVPSAKAEEYARGLAEWTRYSVLLELKLGRREPEPETLEAVRQASRLAGARAVKPGLVFVRGARGARLGASELRARRAAREAKERARQDGREQLRRENSLMRARIARARGGGASTERSARQSLDFASAWHSGQPLTRVPDARDEKSASRERMAAYQARLKERTSGMKTLRSHSQSSTSNPSGSATT